MRNNSSGSPSFLWVAGQSRWLDLNLRFGSGQINGDGSLQVSQGYTTRLHEDLEYYPLGEQGGSS